MTIFVWLAVHVMIRAVVMGSPSKPRSNLVLRPGYPPLRDAVHMPILVVPLNAIGDVREASQTNSEVATDLRGLTFLRHPPLKP